jgi:hypothetical protein
VPLAPGETLIDYLRAQHAWVIDYELTGKMEAILDQIVEHQETWQRFCKAVHNKMGYTVPASRGVNGGPSEAQLKYAAHLAARDKVTIPEEILKSGKALSGWISERVGTRDAVPAPKPEVAPS